MREIVWRFDDPTSSREAEPTDPASAQERLETGNTAFAELFDESGLDTRVIQLSPSDLGVSEDGRPPAQSPFAAVLSCSDARAPVELLLNQRANDVFVVRVAGGVLSEEALGSMDFALDNLAAMQLVAALGHTGCGAVNAAVTTYLDPPSYLSLADSRPLLALVQNLLGSVRLADHALHHVHGTDVVARPGYRSALTATAVVAGAAINASSLAVRIAQRRQPGAAPIGTVYGVYDLLSRRIGLPGTTSSWTPGLVAAPKDGPSLVHALNEAVFGPYITGMLDTSDDG